MDDQCGMVRWGDEMRFLGVPSYSDDISDLSPEASPLI
jgi:hypothetical protein